MVVLCGGATMFMNNEPLSGIPKLNIMEPPLILESWVFVEVKIEIDLFAGASISKVAGK
jgi:hypothetical protein